MIRFFLTETCRIRPYLGQSLQGQRFGPEEVRPCRIEFGTRTRTVYKNPAGTISEMPGNALLFTVGEPFLPESRVEAGGHMMRVTSCHVMRGFGPHHLEADLEVQE